MIDQFQLMQVLEKLRGDAVVMPVFRANIAWNQVTNNPKRDVPVGTMEFPAVMGIGSSLALGFCLARPDTKVILFDGDGSLLVNLGTLVTIANKAPKNLYHFVMDNGVYATTGGQDTPAAEHVSFADLARAAGYARSYQFDDLAVFTSQAESVLNQEGPILVCVKTVPSIRHSKGSGAAAVGEMPRGRPQAISNLLDQFGKGRR